jgi:hypothetical protein
MQYSNFGLIRAINYRQLQQMRPVYGNCISLKRWYLPASKHGFTIMKPTPMNKQ